MSNYNVYNDGTTYDVPPSSPAPAWDSTNPDQNAPAQQESQDTNIAASSGDNSAALVLLYLKDGTVYSARDFWLTGGKLHYTVESGAEGSMDMDQLDMQRTVDENAKHGVPFTLKPGPDGSGAAQDTRDTPRIRTRASSPDTDFHN